MLALVLPSKLTAAVYVSVKPDSAFYAKYSYITFIGPGDSVSVTDDEFYQQAAKLVFAVNRSDPKPDDPLLWELEHDVLPRINADSLELAYMLVRGAASPEGPTDVNRRLGENRCRALYDFINARMLFRARPEAFQLSSDIEDYRSLCRLMEAAGDPDHHVVKMLCDSYLPKGQQDLLKLQLQTMRDGRLWSRLQRDYFPQLRAARVMLFFRKHQEEVVSVAEIAAVTPVEPTTDTLTAATTLTPLEVEPLPEPTLLPERCRSELLAVKTNLLFYGVYMPGYDRWCPLPNVALEYFPRRGHFTLGASLDIPWWRDYDAHKYFQARHYRLEARYYPRVKRKTDTHETTDAARYSHNLHEGFYWQAYANGGIYGICFDADRGWVGEGVGAGLGLGYVVPLSKNHRWRLELGLEAGFATTKYDPYQYENPVDPTYSDNLYYYKWTLSPDLFKKRQYRRTWIGPTRIGVTLSYNLIYRRVKHQEKGGAQ